ncbi:MAG: phosphoribosyl-AMP cyclohydrolase [Acidimicrobiales bacterium]
MATSPNAPGPDTLDAIVYDDQGLVPAVVQEASTGQVLMLGWMNAETVALTLAEGRTVFWSRSRREVWRKGETSGDVQYLRSMSYDCDGDALLVRVDQQGRGACHTGAVSCFHNPIVERVEPAPGPVSNDPASNDPASNDPASNDPASTNPADPGDQP